MLVFVFTDSHSSIVVTWVTFNQTETQVQYGLHNNKTDLSKTALGSSTQFVVGEIKRYIHRVSLVDLLPLSHYGEFTFDFCETTPSLIE